MGSTGLRLLTAAILRRERHAAKEIERKLGCSPAQADRIVKTGRAPGAFKLAFRSFLVELRRRNLDHLAELDKTIKALDYEAMVSRAATRRPPTLGGDP